VIGALFPHVKPRLKFWGLPRKRVGTYGDSREMLLEILAVVIILSPISSVRGVCVAEFCNVLALGLALPSLVESRGVSVEAVAVCRSMLQRVASVLQCVATVLGPALPGPVE